LILDRLDVDAATLERLTGWRVTGDSICREDRCVPFATSGPAIDVAELAARLGLPLVHDEAHGLWSLGPESGARALASARMPPLVLPDLDGRDFDVASLRGRKVLLLAWGSY
jgi:hypothetical protein